jgi:uncharacterized membrane protein
MKKSFLIYALLAFLSFNNLQAQDVYFTKTAKLDFDATPANPVEKIEAVNNEGTSILNLITGNIVFGALIQNFRFEKALMEEHFNENYMESSKFPKAFFTGDITNLKDVNFKKDGEYKVNVKGNLTMHGVTKPISTDGVIIIKGGKISSKAAFTLKLADYNVDRPSVVASKISEIAKISVFAKYELKK